MMAAAHVFSPNLLFLDRTPRRVWLSLSGGISVAYLFAHLLPELAHLQRAHFNNSDIEAALYLMALGGFVSFYGLERAALQKSSGTSESATGAFWLHLGSFGIYNVLIGYLLHEQARIEGQQGLLLYAGAMTLHFIVNDRSLYRHHGKLYTERGRWVLASAAFLGWGAGLIFEIDMRLVAGAMAFLAGSVVLNVIKEELPKERESRFWAFATGAGLYAALLLS
jgi:hypothetical protein